MKDTPPAIERKFRRMLLERSGEERLKMGCSMHATAQALAKASLLANHPACQPAELKRLLFLRFYGADFTPEQRNRIASALSKVGQLGEATGARKRTMGKPVGPIHLTVMESAGAGAVRETAGKYGGKEKGKTKHPWQRAS